MYRCFFLRFEGSRGQLRGDSNQVCQIGYISPLPPTVFQMSPATQQMQPTQTMQSPPPSGGRRRRVVDEDPDERRRKFLERNRAAATRCRQKRKVWVMSLEKKAEELTQTNMQLQVHNELQALLQ